MEHKVLQELYTKRKADYGNLSFFDFQRKDCPSSSCPQRRLPADLERRLSSKRRQERLHSKLSSRSRKATRDILSKSNLNFPSAPAQFDLQARSGPSQTICHTNCDLEVYKIHSQTKKKVKKAPSSKRVELECQSTERIKSGRCPRRSSSIRSRSASVASSFDPNLLETTDDEDNIFHSPYPMLNSGTRRSHSIRKPKSVERTGFHNPDRCHKSQTNESRPVTYKTCRRSILQWMANKICRRPRVKHS